MMQAVSEITTLGDASGLYGVARFQAETQAATSTDRVLEAVRKYPGIEAVTLRKLVPGGNGIARILVQGKRLERVGQRYYLPGEAAGSREAAKAQAAAARRALLNEVPLGTLEELEAFVRAHPGTDSGAVHRTLGARTAAQLYRLVSAGRIRREGPRKQFRYYPLDEPAAPPPPAPQAREVAPVVSAASTTTAATSPKKTTPAAKEKPTKKRAPRGQTRMAILAFLREHPGASLPMVQKLVGRQAGTQLLKLQAAGLAKRSGARGRYAYSATKRRAGPRGRAPAPAATRKRTTRTTSSRPSLERAKRLQAALAEYVELQEQADAALARYEKLAQEDA